MKIAFDAKRAYQNGTGLGHYSRTLVSSLADFYPEHQYFLCAPKLTNRFNLSRFSNIENIVPSGLLSKTFKSYWRSSLVKSDLKKNGIELYHGLSHEIPAGLYKTNIRSVVTIHDLIFERYPKQYNPVDVRIYRHKFKYACRHANQIIAISEQTKEDIIGFYKIPAERITVCYQSCNPAFAAIVPHEEKERIRQLYKLPDRFFLYVGSIIERKNLLNICKALCIFKGKMEVPLVVMGDGGAYKKQVKEYIRQQNMESRVIFLSETEAAKNVSFQTAADFPAIYQLAAGLIYPSVFEGFGIPVLEAMLSGIPVITSNVSCLPETGGDAAYYINPYKPEEIAKAMMNLLTDAILVANMKEKGIRHAQKFTPQKCAAQVMQVYLRLQ